MPALQSFSLPRSGPRVTARPCPPVVLRQRRRDYEALFRSEIRSDGGSWPNRIARCSPGLPHLKPHPNATPQPLRERRGEGRQGPAQGGSIGWPVRCAEATAARRLRPHRLRGGGRDGLASLNARTPMSPDRLTAAEAASSPVLPQPDDGRRPLPIPRRPARSSPARQRIARGRVCRSSCRGVHGSRAPRGHDRRGDRSICSAAYREVGGRRRWGPRCQRVDQVTVRCPG